MLWHLSSIAECNEIISDVTSVLIRSVSIFLRNRNQYLSSSFYELIYMGLDIKSCLEWPLKRLPFKMISFVRKCNAKEFFPISSDEMMLLHRMTDRLNSDIIFTYINNSEC